MSSSSQIRDVSNLEIVVELYLLIFSAEKIQIGNSQSMPKKANKSFLLWYVFYQNSNAEKKE